MPSVVDPTPCVVRHIRRTRTGETGVTLLGATFTAASGVELDAFNGRAGWQAAQAALALSDGGTLTIRFPNTAGDDGVLHRRRFALLTDPVYRIGEEWLEVYRGAQMKPDELVGVFTPRGWRMDRGTLEMSCVDMVALYGLARSSELDIWRHGPRDVFDFYTRLPVPHVAYDLATGAGLGGTVTVTGGVAPGAVPGQRLESTTSPATVKVDCVSTGSLGDAWEASATLVYHGPLGSPPSSVELTAFYETGNYTWLQLFPSSGNVELHGFGPGIAPGAALKWRAKGKTSRPVIGSAALRLVGRGRWVFGFVEGELVVRARRQSTVPPTRVFANVQSGDMTVQRMDCHSLQPFGLRGADKGSLKLPGVPTPGGLRGDYYNDAAAASTLGRGSIAHIEATLDPLDKAESRLDPTINFPSSATQWQPPAAQDPGRSFSARWAGAINLDLSGNGRRLRITIGGNARVWVGRTLAISDAIIDNWTGSGTPAAPLVSPNLKPLLPEGSGWYPIVVEYVNSLGIGSTPYSSIVLEESALDASGNPTGGWTVVPATKLSPLGCYHATHRHESHREIIDAITETFGYQWRVDPRTLESGEFPGQIIPRVRVGVDTDKIVTSDDAVELASEGDAADAVDRLLIDAAGIADPNGSGQLTADVSNDTAIQARHLFLSTGAESLPEITERNLLQQRADSMIALRSSPNEQVAARPTGLRDELTDTFPLTGVLARRRWRPGDGLRLALTDLSVIDETPRQLVAVTQDLYRQGVGVPTIGFRQRPRGLRAFLKRTARMAAAAQRTYQGQIAVVTGSYGNLGGGGDAYSRVPWPAASSQVIGADLVVEQVTGTGTIEINGVSTGITVDAPGRYHVDPTLDGANQRMYARVTGATTYQCHLELRIRL